MSPVHVIVGQDERAERMWESAFAGAVDIYRFERNVDAFERLTAAQAPIDLLVVTPAQSGPFNLTPDQLVARLFEGPLATSPMLAHLHVIVVGMPITREHPRVAAVRTLDAAIRLVKFGEVEEAPRPTAPTRRTPSPQAPAAELGGPTFSDTVISKIWAASDAAAANAAPVPAAAQLPVHVPARADVSGGGAGAPRLFASQAQRRARPEGSSEARAVRGGGETPVGSQAPAFTPAEDAAHALQPARPYELPHGAGYRGPAMRAGHAVPVPSQHGSAAVAAPAPERSASGQPVPPALASQVQAMVYSSPAAPVADPLLTWSSGKLQVAPPPVLPANGGAQPQLQRTAQEHVPLNVAVPSPPQLRTMPLEPPAGVYGGMPAGLVPSGPSVVDADPFVQRAAQDSGVSFG